MVKYDRKDDFQYLKWAAAVKKRDNYTCTICGRRGIWLESHHIKSWDWAKEDRYSLENGTTLCQSCHQDNGFHRIYGKGNNTEEQFTEFEYLSNAMIDGIYRKMDIEDAIKDLFMKVEKDLDGYQDGY